MRKMRLGVVTGLVAAASFLAPGVALAQGKGGVEVFFGINYLDLKIEGLERLARYDSLDTIGIHGEIAFYLTDSFGLVLDASFPRKTLEVTVPAGGQEVAASVDFTQASYLVGSRFRFNPGGVLTPSIQGLVGWYSGSVGTSTEQAFDGPVLLGLEESGWAASVGATLDIRLGDSFALRLPQVGVLFTGYGDGYPASLRLSVGIVGRF